MIRPVVIGHGTGLEVAGHGIDADPPSSPDGRGDVQTAWVIDPDGNRVELVQWPAGDADGMTATDWDD